MRAALGLLALMPTALSAAELPAWAQGLADRFNGVLSAATLQPDLAHLAGVVLLLGVLPMSMVVPMSLLSLLAAAAFPPLLAAPVVMAGLLLNTALAWAAARTVLGSRLEAWLERRGGALGAVREGARRNGLKWAILCRYIPAPFIAAPMVLASTGVGLGTALLGTFIGMSPWVVAYVWVAKAGRQGSLGSIGLAASGLVAVYLLTGWLRRRYAEAPLPEPLRPRDPGLPLVTLYTVPGHELSDEARTELAGLRDRLGFEVEEQPLGEGSDPALRAAYEDHAPVALLGAEKLFNFKMDENVLRVRLEQRRRREQA